MAAPRSRRFRPNRLITLFISSVCGQRVVDVGAVLGTQADVRHAAREEVGVHRLGSPSPYSSYCSSTRAALARVGRRGTTHVEASDSLSW